MQKAEINQKVLIVGFGEGAFVLDYLKDTGKVDITTVSMHSDPAVTNSVQANIKYSYKDASNAQAEALYSKFIDYADMIVIITGYDEHHKGAYQLAEAARKREKPTFGVLVPDLEKGCNAHDVPLQKRVGSRTDVLVRVMNDAVAALGHLSERSQKHIVRKHVGKMALHMAESSHKIPKDKGFYTMREALTDESKTGIWMVNFDFERRTRGSDAPPFIKCC